MATGLSSTSLSCPGAWPVEEPSKFQMGSWEGSLQQQAAMEEVAKRRLGGGKRPISLLKSFESARLVTK